MGYMADAACGNARIIGISRRVLIHRRRADRSSRIRMPRATFVLGISDFFPGAPGFVIRHTPPVPHERKILVSLIAVLLGFGILMVHSASITSRPSEVERVYLWRHLVFVAVGVLSAVLAGQFPGWFWKKTAPWLFWGSFGLLVLVLVPGVGSRINGAQRWFRHGSLSVQPSELMKITLPLYLCYLAERRRAVLNTWLQGALGVAFPLLLVVPAVMLEPDLGTALFLATTGAIALYVAGWPVRNFLVAALPAVPAIIAAVVHRPYQ